MNAVAKVEQLRPSLITMMASQRNMDPEQFAKTVRATVMPANHTNEQFAALMLVASKYDLDPILKEIYAFPAKGGGIVPIVSIDGWVNLINSHPQFDGVEFDFDHDDAKSLVSCTCRIFRKDRSRPVEVTEYLSECVRSTDPWKMKHRMLRHKAMIQAARYAFGFAGIYDEDEGSKIAEARDITPAERPTPPKPPAPPAPPTAKVIEADPPTEEQPTETDFDLGGFLEELETSLATAKDSASAAEIWSDYDAPAVLESAGHADMIDTAFAIRDRAYAKLEPYNGG
ncbi:recombinase RecT [Shinella daejeonensis]|uniref:recombinase RecT n=1 Tax=Shinella daejeonensis TaxID=659017 RepID=UPI0020C77550|nr:recombinase RecT [Shinella daejeonensis]MCP8895308.1 recombinase RecT [Shinella daejeonensis]